MQINILLKVCTKKYKGKLYIYWYDNMIYDK